MTPPLSVVAAFDCRYAGQSHELRVASVADFGVEHRRHNGYDRPGDPVEVTAVRVVATLDAPARIEELCGSWVGRWGGGPVVGPRVVARDDCTIWVPQGWQGTEGALGSAGPAPQRGARSHDADTRFRSDSTRPGCRSSSRDWAASPRRWGRSSAERVQSQHQGARRLLGRGVRLRRPTAGPGRAHPGAPRVDACLGGSGHRALGDRLGPGDQAVVNDPFAGGTHLNDITVVAPCFADGGPADARLVGWVANRAHHADVGGSAPGSIPADATDIHAEGLRLPPVLLTDDVRAVLLANSRTPRERSGDLEAQVGANVVGVRRLAELADSPFDAVLRHGERRCRAVLGALEPGEVTGAWTSWTPPDPASPSSIRPPSRWRSRSSGMLDGPSITFDFSGTDDQRWGNTNAVEAVTVSSVAFALRAALDHTLPANAGVMAPVRVIAPEGSIVAARAPVAVGAGNVEVSQRIADVCQLALGADRPRSGSRSRSGDDEQHPHRWRRRSGTGLGLLRDRGRGTGGSTATHRRSWRSCRCGNVRCAHRHDQHPEHPDRGAGAGRIPMRVLRVPAAAGAAAAPARRRAARASSAISQVLEDATVSLITERRVSQPWGLAGGEPGAVGENWLLPGGDESTGRAPAGQVHDPAQGRRRPADADAGWRRLGEAVMRGTGVEVPSGGSGAGGREDPFRQFVG